jgi:hypothetical protein
LLAVAAEVEMEVVEVVLEDIVILFLIPLLEVYLFQLKHILLQ